MLSWLPQFFLQSSILRRHYLRQENINDPFGKVCDSSDCRVNWIIYKNMGHLYPFVLAVICQRGCYLHLQPLPRATITGYWQKSLGAQEAADLLAF